LTTNHPEFDKRLGAGFLPKTLSILAAPPELENRFCFVI